MPIVPGSYWDLLERNRPPVKHRAWHEKARTGCATCKRRRVKCDEAKPNCARCIKSGHRCAGYEDTNAAPKAAAPQRGHSRNPPKHPGKSTTPHQTLRPKPKPQAVSPGSGPRNGERAIGLLRASLTPAYLDARDALYFERFKCQVLADLGAWCGAEYWRHTILREILTNKTVQHAALAAAAMLMNIEEQQQTQYENSELQRVYNTSPALSQAGTQGIAFEDQPLKTTRRTSAPSKEALPAMPLSGASAHGKAALRHYTAAIGRCRQTLAAEGVTSSTARSSLTATFYFAVFELVQGNVGEADQILSSGVSLLEYALSQTGPDGNPALVPDDELREIQLAFDRMRITWGLCPYFGSDKAARPKTSRRPRARHFDLPSPDASMRTKQVFWNAFSSDFGQFMVSVRGRREHDLSAALTQRTKYLSQLRHWLPILENLCAQNPESLILCTTKAYAQTAIIFLNCFLDRSELAYDAYLPTFKDIVAAYRRLLPSEAQPGYLRLTLDVDLFHIITFTVSKCRDEETRALALHVFGEMTRRQALWTNAGMLAALRALADLEDSGRDVNGFVPASSRYDYAGSEWDFEKRQMMAVFEPVLHLTALSGDASTIRVPIDF